MSGDDFQEWGKPSRSISVPLRPNEKAIRQHIQWLIQPVLVGNFDDAQFEIASQFPDGGMQARLFILHEVDEAVAYAVRENEKGRNVYIGAALKVPEADPYSRTNISDFYVATAVPADVDENYNAVMERMAGTIGHSELTVVTGTKPARRSHHWFRLAVLCTENSDFQRLFATLVYGLGADKAAKDPARLMRLGGTIAYPPQRKKDRGYQVELTTVIFKEGVAPLREAQIMALEPVQFETTTGRAVAVANRAQVDGEIIKDGYGKVVDGREQWFRNLVFAMIAMFQEQNGCDPRPEDIAPEAFKIFAQRCDTSDGRWTQTKLMRRIVNTFRRFDAGHLSLKPIGQPRPAEALPYQWGERLAAQATGPQIKADTNPDAPAAASEPPVILEWAEWKATYRKPKFLVKKMLQYGYVYTITGRPGTGKTAVAITLSFCVARGEKFGPHQCKKGRVLFCAGENSPEVNVRTTALEEALGLDGLNIAFIPRVFSIEAHLGFIRDYIEKHGEFDLIVVDTLQAFFPGEDENSNPEMIAYVNKQIRPMAELPGNPCVLVLAHPAKSAATKDEMQPRGAGGFTGAIDGNITLWREDKAEKVVEFAPHVEKFRGAPFDPINIELITYESAVLKDEDGDPMTSVIARVIDANAMQAKRDKAALEQDNVMLAMLNLFKADNKWPSAQKIAKELGNMSDRNVQRIQTMLANTKPAKDKYVERKGERQPYVLTSKGVDYVEQVIKESREEFHDGYFVIET